MKNISFITKNIKGLNVAKSINNIKSVRQQGQTAKISYIPPRFTFTITSKCNLRCPTCQYVIKDESFFENSSFMPIEDYKSILNQYKNFITNLTLTGGEVTLHPELEKLIDFSISQGLKVSLISNGILIRKQLSAIKKLYDLNITLDAVDFQSFARNRGGTEKQWDRIMEGLNTLKDHGIKFTVSFLVTRKNIDELFQLIEFADAFRPTTLRLNSFNPHSDDHDLVLTKSDPHVMGVVREMMQRKDYLYNIKLPFVFDDRHSYFSNKICLYPWHGVYINETGDVAYCCQLAHDTHIGNMHNGYDFNSPRMLEWRKMLLNHRLVVDCKYCHRRFKGDYSKFNAAKKKWTDNDPFK
ncbi:MAG: radical SAM protein [Desulfobacterales bacterium]|jgi:MoaA/NifB/PqqE/SkfB family radical SAM enzyme